MSSGGADPPRPPSHQSNGKGKTAKKRRYMVRLLPPRDILPSSTPSPSSVSMLVRPLDVAPTPSPPPIEARLTPSDVNAHGSSLVLASTPSPSSVDARGLSLIPTFTPSPSPTVVNMPTDVIMIILRFDVAPSVGESQLPPLDPAEEQRLRSRCWVVAAGPKHKGRLYGTGDLAHTYKCGNDIFMKHTKGSSCHTEDAAEINRLKEELCQSKGEMHVFQSVVLQFLLPEARNIIHQQQQPHQQHQD
ncbi:vegetative cell wall protein gp1-like [Glycine max]|uniref:vegetative cell wall protein gp1-like n=1 Tax=Glycine max TaxID=3847 RepID=UPI001B3545E2|nr:vegetative cell wall protein gp1-like [Glycine max]